MRTPLVLGNWKQNGSLATIADYAAEMAKQALPTTVEAGICPPALYVAAAINALKETKLAVGSQDCSEYSGGAFTGEINAAMISDMGCGYALVGHSERREMFGDTNARVADKFIAVKATDVTPVLCIGESLQDRESEKTFDVVGAQLRAVLEKTGEEGFIGGVIAYEPVWAIGTGLTASPEQAQEVHEFIRGVLAEFGETLKNSTRLLYGGSVNKDNARALFEKPDIDGGLIGGASLKVNDFAAVIQAAG
ncbi:triose-phosphate isomerase [Pelagibaculum spongiae]|uniref:Triosephosphate isomerase n=1 Tax=Pelagibaculum spongiae TaxID=2080658 RepID=A0A2V1H5S9_9GAMM|nr:triose-phosphate isomerase [Pelagibaculum spongiae]PVZ71782.1 triose-phosphate isomerase [Pelagibaculum spongiae]